MQKIKVITNRQANTFEKDVNRALEELHNAQNSTIIHVEYNMTSTTSGMSVITTYVAIISYIETNGVK